jgi:hypothetical protein
MNGTILVLDRYASVDHMSLQSNLAESFRRMSGLTDRLGGNRRLREGRMYKQDIEDL